jgi:hypothetical protein
MAFKEAKTREKEESEIKLDRAQKLTMGLSDEKVRWAFEIEVLG